MLVLFLLFYIYIVARFKSHTSGATYRWVEKLTKQKSALS